MSYISFEFVVLFILLYILLSLIRNKSPKFSLLIILIVNLFFYADLGFYPFLILLFQTVFSFSIAIIVENVKAAKSRLFYTIFGVAVLLGILSIHKYLLNSLSGYYANFHSQSFKVVYPLGLSFFTFQAIIYIIDIYWEKYEACRDFIKYAAFLSFFPTVISGPINRFNSFEEQIEQNVPFSDNVIPGLRLILIGVFKKLVVIPVLISRLDYHSIDNGQFGFSALVGLFIYSIYIYTDFSSFTDIALGLGFLLGIKLPENFNLPYLSVNVSEFWRKWHMSLSNSLNEYVYTPLVMYLRPLGKFSVLISVFITFILCGLWHGNTVNYILWGIANAIFILPSYFFRTIRETKNSVPYKYFKIVLNFILISFLWLLFKEDNLERVVFVVKAIFDLRDYWSISTYTLISLLVIPVFIILDYIIVNKLYLISFNLKGVRINLSYLVYYAMIVLIIFSKASKTEEFIYFKF